MQKCFEYSYKDKIYPVIVTYKKTHRIAYHFRDNKLIIYCPYFTTKKTIFDGLDKFVYRLVDQNPMCNKKGDDYIYILGEKIDLFPSGVLTFSDGKTLKYKDHTSLEKQLKKWFKAFLEERVKYYENKMGTCENIVKVRNMTSRYGSNAVYSHSITFATILMHFSIDIIDAIIIHELAHCFHHGHGNSFYNVVYKNCPNYDLLHKKLRKGEFK